MNLAYYNDMDVITDSFPRKPQQLLWLMNSSFASTRNVNVEMRFLYVDENDHKDRISGRMALCGSSEEKEFLQQRIDTDRASMIEIHQLTKKMIASGNYKALSIKEMQI